MALRQVNHITVFSPVVLLSIPSMTPSYSLQCSSLVCISKLKLYCAGFLLCFL
jgi:hypothetical protein